MQAVEQCVHLFICGIRFLERLVTPAKIPGAVDQGL